MGTAAEAEEIGSNGSGRGGGGGDEFYEDIEAPKFVDFTAPDHYCPDDRYWFCSRVGCDQKHENELDPDEINKNFVLRVMAARSPNLRLRKMLTRKPTNTMKCPLSAPPKRSRPRISRLAVLSSISKKLIDGKERAKPVRPITVTPNPKAKKPSLVCNAVTTPGNKKRVLNQELFRSVRNPKEATAPMQSTKVIAKALTFQSSKKVARKKASSELDASVRKICTGMKKLEITGQRKNALGYEKTLASDATKKRPGAREVKSRVYNSLRTKNNKGKENGPSRCTKKKGIETGTDPMGMKKLEITGQRKNALGYEKTSASDATKKRPVAREVKSRVYNSLRTKNNKGKENGPSRCTKKKKGIETGTDPMAHDGSSGDSSDMEVDSHRGSLEESSVSGALKSELFDVPVVQAGTDELTKELTLHVEELAPGLEMEATQNVLDSAHNEDVVSASDREGGHEVSENDDKENASLPHDNSKPNEVSENDDKENATAPDDNRKLSKGKSLNKQGTEGKLQKATRKAGKSLKENSGDPRSAQGGKYIKPRPTNPKPFRLRTDERGVLKEANLEKKLPAPSKETIMTVSGFTAGNLPAKKHQNPSKRNGNVPPQSEDGMHQDGSRIKSNFSSSCLRVGEHKTSTVSSERRLVSKQQRTSAGTSQLQSQESIRRAKLLLLKQQSQRTTSKKAAVSSMTRKPRLVKETSGKGAESKEEPKLNENAVKSASKTAFPGASRSLSRGRRPPTIPKEPNFHSIHVPRSCAQKVA